MAHLVLARKLRPKKYDQVVGQMAIVQSLKISVRDQKIGHAYLFSGTRGVGKTTVARLFAKALRCSKPLNGEHCGMCPPCVEYESSIDVIEIDGASNNTVEGIRELISNCKYLPTIGSYKVYIIDEVHMLSNSAFNALLKTLEEPPAHVIFILATTEPDHLPETVLSRCLHYNFKSASSNDLLNFLKQLKQSDQIIFEDEDLMIQLSHAAKGSYRDLLTLLEQLSALSDQDKITEKCMMDVLGISSKETVGNTVSALLLFDEVMLMEVYQFLKERNIDLSKYLEQVLNAFFVIITEKRFSKYNTGMAETIWIYEELSRDAAWIMLSPSPVDSLLICMFKILSRRKLVATIDLNDPSEIVANKLEKKNEASKLKKFEFREFVSLIRDKNPTISANLEYGQIKDFEQRQDKLQIYLMFGEKNKVSYDFVSDNAIQSKIVEYAKAIYNCASVEVEFSKVKTGEPFISLHDELEQEAVQEKNRKENEFRENPLLKQAETFFNTKVDKVIINNRY